MNQRLKKKRRDMKFKLDQRESIQIMRIIKMMLHNPNAIIIEI